MLAHACAYAVHSMHPISWHLLTGQQLVPCKLKMTPLGGNMDDLACQSKEGSMHAADMNCAFCEGAVGCRSKHEECSCLAAIRGERSTCPWRAGRCILGAGKPSLYTSQRHHLLSQSCDSTPVRQYARPDAQHTCALSTCKPAASPFHEAWKTDISAVRP